LARIQNDIHLHKKFKSGQQGVEKNSLLNELKSKTQKLIQKQDKYENEFKKKMDEFKQIRNIIYQFYMSVECNKTQSSTNKLIMENGVTENNVHLYLSDIENRMKVIKKYFEEYEKVRTGEYEAKGDNKQDDKKASEMNENMKLAFASIDISKVKFDPKGFQNKADVVKFENINQGAIKIAEDILEQIKKASINDKKGKSKKNNK